MDNGASNYRRFLDGDDDGIVEIIKDYKDGLILFLNSYVQNIHVAEDLMEDTFVRIVIKKPRFSGKSSFKTWLYAIGRNVALDYLRKSSRLCEISASEAAVTLRDEINAENQYLADERKILIYDALKKLNPDYRKVIYLTFFEGFTVKETASIIKKSYKQTENLVYRAKRSLKSELEKEGFEYENI